VYVGGWREDEPGAVCSNGWLDMVGDCERPSIGFVVFVLLLEKPATGRMVLK